MDKQSSVIKQLELEMEELKSALSKKESLKDDAKQVLLLKIEIENVKDEKCKLEQRVEEIEALSKKEDQKNSISEMKRSFVHSVNEPEDYSLLLLENENLKKKINVMKAEFPKKDLTEKLENKLKEKEIEIKSYVEQQKESKALIVF